jgi:hypothetical protein
MRTIEGDRGGRGASTARQGLLLLSFRGGDGVRGSLSPHSELLEWQVISKVMEVGGGGDDLARFRKVFKWSYHFQPHRMFKKMVQSATGSLKSWGALAMPFLR